MPVRSTLNDWPARVTDEDVIDVVGTRSFERARRYLAEGRVLTLSTSDDGGIVSGQVRGAGGVYEAVAMHVTDEIPRDGAPAVLWEGSCSCPVGSNCKHSAALLMEARTRAGSPRGAGAEPLWERDLEALLTVPRSGDTPLALEFSEAGTPTWSPTRDLSVRPLIQGRNGWLRRGASWAQVVGGKLEGRAVSAQLGILCEIATMVPTDLSSRDSRIPLHQAPDRIWEVLARGAALGLTLTTAQHGGSPVRIRPGTVLNLDLSQGADGAYTLAPYVDLSGVDLGAAEDVLADLAQEAGEDEVPPRRTAWGEEPTGRARARRLTSTGGLPLRPVGSPVHALVARGLGGELLILPLDPPPSSVVSRLLVNRPGGVVIPAEDVPHFQERYLDPLRRAVPGLQVDRAVDLPEPVTLRAVLRIRVEGATHRSHLTWLMRYSTGSGVRQEVEVGGLTHPSDPGASASQEGGRALDGPEAVRDDARTIRDDVGTIRDRGAELRLSNQLVTLLLPLAAEHGPLWEERELTGMATAVLVSRTLPVLREMGTVLADAGRPCLEVEVVGEVPEYRQADEPPLITTDVTEEADRPDWFSLRVRVRVGSEEIPITQLMAAVASGQSEILLGSGAWVSIDRPEIRQLARLMEEGRHLEDPHAKDGTMRVCPFQAGYYQALVSLGVVGQAAGRWQEAVGRLLAVAGADQEGGSQEGGQEGGSREGSNQEGAEQEQDAGRRERAGGGEDPIDVPLPSGLVATLRPYQVEGYRWLNLLRSHGLGGILADDMGLGKTVQVLAAVQRMVEERQAGRDATANPDTTANPNRDEHAPVLVVAPTSVVGSWLEQAARFCPGLRVVAARRTSARRGVAVSEVATGADVVVTSYTIVRMEEKSFAAQPWSWVVLDEAQFVKNHTSATYKAVRRLRAPSTVGITGTPLENSLTDLWSLLSATAPGLLPGPERFAALYRRPIERGSTERLESLRTRVRPFVLRRTKEQVAADLPEKTEQVLSVELSSSHRRAYDVRLARERQRVMGLLGEDSAQARFSALKSLTTLRLMALDPFLVYVADAQEPDADPATVKRSQAGMAKWRNRAGRLGQRTRSVKADVLLEQLEPVVAEGHKALVFSQFTRYLRSVEEDLRWAGLRTAYLDGTTTNRQEVIDSFRSGQADVFLISLKAGGFGLTLTEADYVFLLDPWWNPQAEAQAVDRAHRIGQDKPVMVYRLVAAGTIEEKIMELKATKAALFTEVVEGGADEALAAEAGGRARLTVRDIRELMEG